ncbi:MAG: peroxiredoxin [Betaproteobacteria bacterium]|jgi:Peroxiredoxin|nr:peroxiredoxin [Betaproteobacteria bacterium]
MEKLELVSDFTLDATTGQPFRLSEQRGAPLVLYFYPKDDTPGCTDEGLQFTQLHDQFADLHCPVWGVSRDSLSSHEKFRAKMGFPFHLLSDPDEIACTLFGVMKLKNMYGKQVRGIERSTFLIDAQGRLAHQWRAVKVPGHAQQVLEAVQQLV